MANMGYITGNPRTTIARETPHFLVRIRVLAKEEDLVYRIMGRWMKPEVYPLLAAMTFATSMCVFQLTRNVFMNPDVRIKKEHRKMGILDNAEEGEKYAMHRFRKYLTCRTPGIFPNPIYSK